MQRSPNPFSNRTLGEYSAEQLRPGTRLAFDLYYCELGWVAFDRDRRPVRGPSVLLISGVKLFQPNGDRRPDVKWQKVIRVHAWVLKDGAEIVLNCTADKPTRDIWRLIREYCAAMSSNVDEEGRDKIPIVEIGTLPSKMVKRNAFVQPFAGQYRLIGWISEAKLRRLNSARR